MYRRLLVRRSGLLPLAAITAGVFRWIPATVTASLLALFLVPPVWIWIAEIRYDRMLARRLERIPGVVTHCGAKDVRVERLSAPRKS